MSVNAPYHKTEAKAIEAANRILASMFDYGPTGNIDITPDLGPTIDHEALIALTRDAWADGARGWAEVRGYIGDNASKMREAGLVALMSDIAEGCPAGMSERPEMLGEAVGRLRAQYRDKQRWQLANELPAAAGDDERFENILGRIAAIGADDNKTSMSMVVRGINGYPTITPPEQILLGNGLMRIADIINFISTAGAGKSVTCFQAAMAWCLGLPYLGIKPSRPLRILLFSGEDDGVTIGQCREGFLKHSKEITGKQLTHEDLDGLDDMLRVDFSREYVGERFHGHLNSLLTEEGADMVIINPMLSYIGGEIVTCASEWLRAGLMPILQKHECGAFIAHHTGKMSKDSWDNTDDTYSAIGGSEIANVPRSILTLRPTKAKGLSVVTVSKRQTTGWADSDGNFTTSYFVKRSDSPERPAWLPVDTDEALELIADGGKQGETKRASSKKIYPSDVVAELKTGDTLQKALIEKLMIKHRCSDKTVETAINEAGSLIESYDERNPRGGKALKWLRLAMVSQGET